MYQYYITEVRKTTTGEAVEKEKEAAALKAHKRK